MNMPPARHLHQRLPDRIHKVVFDQQVPESVGALVEVRHRQVEGDGLQLLWTAAPDGCVREEALVDPGVSLFEFLGSPCALAGTRRGPCRKESSRDAGCGLALPSDGTAASPD